MGAVFLRENELFYKQLSHSAWCLGMFFLLRFVRNAMMNSFCNYTMGFQVQDFRDYYIFIFMFLMDVGLGSSEILTIMYRITKILVLRPAQMLLLPDKPVQLPYHVCNSSSMNSTTCGLKIFRGKNSCLSLLNTDIFWH